MSARRVSREPYRVRRDAREVVIAVMVSALIILATVAAVWVLAPEGDDGPPASTPIPTPADLDTVPSTSAVPSTEVPPPTSVPGSG